MAISSKAKRIRLIISGVLLLLLGVGIWWALRLFKLAEARRSHIQEMVTVDLNGDGRRDLIVGYEAPTLESGSVLSAIDGMTGRTIWERSTPPIGRPIAPRSHMALAKDSVVILRRSRQVQDGNAHKAGSTHRLTVSRYALADGKQIWQRHLAEDVEDSYGVAVDGDLVLLRLMTRTKKLESRLLAISLADGKDRWSHSGVARYAFFSSKGKIIAAGTSKVLAIQRQSGKAQSIEPPTFPLLFTGENFYSFFWENRHSQLAKLSFEDATAKPVQVANKNIQLPEFASPYGVIAFSEDGLWVATGKGTPRGALTFVSLKKGERHAIAFNDGFGIFDPGLLDSVSINRPSLSAFGRLKGRHVPMVLQKAAGPNKYHYRLVVLDTQERKIVWRSKPTAPTFLSPFGDIYAKGGRCFFVVSVPWRKRGFPLQVMMVMNGASGRFSAAFHTKFRQRKWRFQNYPKPIPANFADDALWGFLNAQAWRIDLKTQKLKKFGLGKVELVPSWKRVEAFIGTLPRVVSR